MTDTFFRSEQDRIGWFLYCSRGHYPADMIDSNGKPNDKMQWLGFQHKQHVLDYFEHTEELRRKEWRKKRKEKLSKAWPMEKQRRSNVHWADFVPEHVATTQESWERGATLDSMRDAGMTYNDIAIRFGVSSGRAQQIHAGFKNNYKKHKGRPPIERYLENTPFPDFGALRSRGTRLAIDYLTQMDKARDWLFV